MEQKCASPLKSPVFITIVCACVCVLIFCFTVPLVGGWPSSVDHSAVSVSYSEDTRDVYLGYSTANISWARPLGEVPMETFPSVCV